MQGTFCGNLTLKHLPETLMSNEGSSFWTSRQRLALLYLHGLKNTSIHMSYFSFFDPFRLTLSFCGRWLILVHIIVWFTVNLTVLKIPWCTLASTKLCHGTHQATWLTIRFYGRVQGTYKLGTWHHRTQQAKRRAGSTDKTTRQRWSPGPDKTRHSSESLS